MSASCCWIGDEGNASANRTLVANSLALPAITMAAPSTGTMIISWPAGATGWVLEESNDMDPAG